MRRYATTSQRSFAVRSERNGGIPFTPWVTMANKSPSGDAHRVPLPEMSARGGDELLRDGAVPLAGLPVARRAVDAVQLLSREEGELGHLLRIPEGRGLRGPRLRGVLQPFRRDGTLRGKSHRLLLGAERGVVVHVPVELLAAGKRKDRKKRDDEETGGETEPLAGADASHSSPSSARTSVPPASFIASIACRACSSPSTRRAQGDLPVVDPWIVDHLRREAHQPHLPSRRRKAFRASRPASPPRT